MKKHRKKRAVKSEIGSLNLPIGFSTEQNHISIKAVLQKNEIAMGIVSEKRSEEGLITTQCIAIPFELQDLFLSKARAFHNDAKYFHKRTDRKS